MEMTPQERRQRIVELLAAPTDFAPEIQRHIPALPPIASRGLITERRLYPNKRPP